MKIQMKTKGKKSQKRHVYLENYPYSARPGPMNLVELCGQRFQRTDP